MCKKKLKSSHSCAKTHKIPFDGMACVRKLYEEVQGRRCAAAAFVVDSSGTDDCTCFASLVPNRYLKQIRAKTFKRMVKFKSSKTEKRNSNDAMIYFYVKRIF